MKEEILKQYFEDLVTPETLSNDVEGSEIKTSNDVIRINVTYLSEIDGFKVTKKDLLKLCDDVISGNIQFKHLATIGRVLEFSEYFYWDNETADGRVVVDVITDWANPEINSPLTVENVRFWKTYLETGVYNLKPTNKKSDEG